MAHIMENIMANITVITESKYKKHARGKRIGSTSMLFCVERIK